ncbi:MAG: patatin-like phospholipase family protein [Beijerinckiaceae bacterium]
MLSLLRKSPEVRHVEPENPVSVPERAPPRQKPKVGIALGAGAARGWSHIGVIHELINHGIVPEVVAGTSIGAVVGGCFAAGKLDELEDFARSLTRRRMFSLMDVSFSGSGLLGGGRLKTQLERELAQTHVEDLPIAFAAVATEVGSGHEVWLTRGPVVEAIRASYALPGVFEPVKWNGRWLFDGALVNPVPVAVCRALGADLVIAVNLIGDTMFRGTVISDRVVVDHTLQALDVAANTVDARPAEAGWRGQSGFFRRTFGRRADGAPGIASAMLDALNITQDRIARSRLAGDPPDVTISARGLGQFGLFDFQRADELIASGREAASRALGDIEHHLATVSVGARRTV